MLRNTLVSLFGLLVGAATASAAPDFTGFAAAPGPTITSLSNAGSVSTSATPPVLYDSFPTGAPANSTGSTPNTFMGLGSNLVAGASSITGFDVYPVNVSGTNFDHLKINIFVWDTVNTSGTVNATTPAFGTPLASYSLTSTGAYNTGFFYRFESATPGILPGISLATPLLISDSVVGLTFNYQGSTDGGVTYNSFNNLTSVISGTDATYTSNPVVTGSLVLGGATGGYYRNAGTPTETNGNFTSGLRTLGGLTNQGVAVRVYGTAVPEPTSLGIIAAFGLITLRRRAS